MAFFSPYAESVSKTGSSCRSHPCPDLWPFLNPGLYHATWWSKAVMTNTNQVHFGDSNRSRCSSPKCTELVWLLLFSLTLTYFQVRTHGFFFFCMMANVLMQTNDGWNKTMQLHFCVFYVCFIVGVCMSPRVVAFVLCWRVKNVKNATIVYHPSIPPYIHPLIHPFLRGVITLQFNC